MKIFIDIETVPNDWLDQKLVDVFAKKYLEEWEKIDEALYRKSALYPEFWKIVCISLGSYDKEWVFKTKSFAMSDERNLLVRFAEMLDKVWDVTWIGHNVKWFDLPFIVKRFFINGVILPKQLQFNFKKPREVEVHDTMELWKWLWRDNSSLELISLCLWVENPKDRGDWSDVKLRYWLWDFDKIKEYCEWDIKATSEVYEIMVKN